MLLFIVQKVLIILISNVTFVHIIIVKLIYRYIINKSTRTNLIGDPMKHNVIDRLSLIETRAVRISNETESEIKILAERMEQNKKIYEENLLAETADRLKQLEDEMNLQKDREIVRLQQEADEAIQKTQAKFANQQEEIADQLVRAMIKV